MKAAATPVKLGPRSQVMPGTGSATGFVSAKALGISEEIRVGHRNAEAGHGFD